MNSTTTTTGRLPANIRFGLTNDDLAAPAVILWAAYSAPSSPGWVCCGY